MKILMLAPEPFFEARGTPFSVLWRLRVLSQLGHNVDLLTYHPGQDVSIPNVVIHRTPHIRFIKHVRVGPSATKLFLDILVLIKAFRLLRTSRYDLLHTHEEASFFGILLAKIFGVPHLYDMHSSLPQQLSNFRYTRFRLLIRLFEWLESQTINASDAIITICPALEGYVNKLNGHVPHVMIENTAVQLDLDAVSEEDALKFKATYGVEHKKIVLYTGTFESYQGIDLLIESASRVVQRCRDVAFLLIGGHADQVNHYQKKVKKLGLANFFRFAGMRPPEEIPRAISLSHVLVSPRVAGINTPLKIYAYLQSGKPIVATDLYTHTQVLNSDAAVLVKPDPDSLARGILSLLENPLLAVKVGEQGRELFENQYSIQTIVQKTEQILQLALR